MARLGKFERRRARGLGALHFSSIPPGPVAGKDALFLVPPQPSTKENARSMSALERLADISLTS